MENKENKLNIIILILTIVTLGSLFVSATGGVIDSFIPAYFWYLALLGMLALLALWIIMAIMLTTKLGVRWYLRNHPL